MVVKKVADSFENGVINRLIWKNKQIEPHQIDFSSDAADGDKSIVITTVAGDSGVCYEQPCQRAELRLHGNLRPEYGEEVWYSFAFKVTGDIRPIGSNRTVIGQWKAPGDDSPFLAQRFDNGVFHVTIQDGPKRITVASAEGDPDRLVKFQDLVAKISSDPKLGTTVVSAEKALAELKAFRRFQSVDSFSPGDLPGDMPQFEGLRAATEKMTELKADRINQLFEEFHFIQELEAYGSRPNVKIERMSTKRLPDPKHGWVHMMYRIKGGRKDNIYGPNQEGEIDIWANNEFIARVMGNVGYRLPEPPNDTRMYFKFGMYRNPLPNTIHFHFDRFRQGKTRTEVE